jgi:hypothetical protein
MWPAVAGRDKINRTLNYGRGRLRIKPDVIRRRKGDDARNRFAAALNRFGIHEFAFHLSLLLVGNEVCA